jgi:3-methyladenine DNA glycosylase/8-oxoguanine DNA glycosylase
MIGLVLQNAPVGRSVKMLQALLSKLGKIVHFDSHQLFCFWTPADGVAASDKELRRLRIGYRAKSLRRISMDFLDFNIKQGSWRDLANDELMSRLRKIYGVGPATAGILAFETFHRYDLLKHVPPWERKIFAKVLYGQEMIDETQILRDAAHRWGNYRTLALHYIFEDLFWRHSRRAIPWLAKLIRL